MIRQVRYIAITVGVLVLVVAALLLLKFLPGAKKSTSSSSASASSTSKTLTKIDAANVKMLQVTNKNGTYTIRKNGSSWTVDQIVSLPLSQSSITSMVDSAVGVQATQTIAKNVTDFSPYGLSSPAVTLSILTTDGKTTTLKIGGKSPGTSYGYYAVLGGDSTVYLIDSSTAEGFMNSSASFLDLSLSSVDSKSFTKLTGFTFAGASRTSPIKLNIGDTSSYSASADSSGNVTAPAYSMTAPGSYPTNAENLTTLCNALTALSASDVVTTDVSDKTLSGFGLKNPAYTLSYTYSGKTTTLSFGNTFSKNGSEDIYVMVSGKNVVYDIATSSVPFYKWSITDLADSLAFSPPNIDTVKTITITSGSKTWRYNLSGTGDALVVKSDSKKLSTDNFRQFYQTVVGMSWVGESEVTNGNLLCRVTFDYRTASKKSDVIEIRNIDSYKAEYILNGMGNFYIKMDTLNTMLTQAQDVIDGKTISAS